MRKDRYRQLSLLAIRAKNEQSDFAELILDNRLCPLLFAVGVRRVRVSFKSLIVLDHNISVVTAVWIYPDDVKTQNPAFIKELGKVPLDRWRLKDSDKKGGNARIN